MSNYGIGVSGLRANNTAIDVISTNIANAATVGYKAGEFLFQDQFFKALNPMDPARAGQGALQQNIRRLFNMGSVQDSANTLDMAITGASGMFQVASSTNPKEIFYTRNGQFAVSSEQSPAGQNYIVNENGMYLTGYGSTDGVTIDDGDSLNKLTMPPTELPPVTTTVSEVAVTLDARTNAFLTSGSVQFNPLVPTTYHHKVSQTVFSREDNGGDHTLTLYYRRVQDKEMLVRYDADSEKFFYAASQVGQQNSSTDANNVYMSEDTSAGISFVTSPSRVTQLDADTVAATAAITVETHTNIEKYARVVVDGRDTGRLVAAAPTTSSVAITASPTATFATAFDEGTEISFFNPAGVHDVTAGVTVTVGTSTVDSLGEAATVAQGGTSATIITISTTNATFPTFIAEGQYLWVDDGGTTIRKAADTLSSSDSAFRILKVNSTTGQITLEGEVHATVATAITNSASNLLFYDPVSYNLTSQDSSKVVMKGDLFNESDNQAFYAVTTQYEVYGQLDNHYYNWQDPSFNSRNPEGLEATISGAYDPIAVMGFWGGKNIDSLVYDAETGDPAFKSQTTLNAVITTTGTADPQNEQGLSFDLDLTGARNYATPFSVDLSKQDGSSVAQINAVTVDKEGKVIGSYGDGRQYISGQLALVQFHAVNDLVAVGGNVFMAKAQENPGIEGYIVGKPGEKGLGEIRASAVEASNVDLTNELVKLMQMQRMYSANSQSVRAFDDTLTTTIRMTGG
jgi:flagellar hook protein FlgE